MRSRNHNKIFESGTSPLGFLLILGGLFFLLLGISGPRLIGSQPELSLVDLATGKPVSAPSIGRFFPLMVKAENTANGVCFLKVSLFQGGIGKELVAKTGVSGSWFKSWLRPWTGVLSGPHEPIDLTGQGITAAEAELVVEASDCSFWRRKAVGHYSVKVDLLPPSLALTSAQHYINQGGADVATYSVSTDAVISGIKVGPYEFTGYQKPGGASGEHFVFFVWSYELSEDTQAQVFARDAAGNETTAALVPAKFFKKEFRRRDIPIDDKFIQTKVRDIIAGTPELTATGDNLKDYLQVNRELRRVNARFLVDLSKQSAAQFYWKDAFRPLTNAAVEASFADYRTYFYNQQEVDQQVHLGFDLAVVEHNPILAAAAGRVVFTGFLGIYGNTVIIDHGYGLVTLYAHLSSMDVAKDEFIQKDQKIANSGATGLAAGDHLHFSMLIQGVQTNPIEFWDQHWIDDHVYLRIGKDAFQSDDRSQPPSQKTVAEPANGTL